MNAALDLIDHGHQGVAVDGRPRLDPQAGIGQQHDRNWLGQMAAVLAQESDDLLARKRDLLEGEVCRIDEQNNLDRRVGLYADSIEGVEGENLARLVVVHDLEVRRFEAEDRLAPCVGDKDIEMDAGLRGRSAWMPRVPAGWRER